MHTEQLASVIQTFRVRLNELNLVGVEEALLAGAQVEAIASAAERRRDIAEKDVTASLARLEAAKAEHSEYLAQLDVAAKQKVVLAQEEAERIKKGMDNLYAEMAKVEASKHEAEKEVIALRAMANTVRSEHSVLESKRNSLAASLASIKQAAKDLAG